MNGLHILEEQRAGLLDRLRGRKPKEQAAAAVNNYVATTPLANVTVHDINRILTEHKCHRQDIKPALTAIYTQVLTHCTQDARLTAQEQSDLEQLRAVLGLTQEEADALDREALLATYQAAVRGFFADGHFTFREREQVERLTRTLYQDEAAADAVVMDEAFRAFERSTRRGGGSEAAAGEDETE